MAVMMKMLAISGIIMTGIPITTNSLVQATPYTYNVASGQSACFYATVNQVGPKVRFDFATQAGGSFDIDYVVKDPNGRVVLQGEKEKQGEFVFSGNTIGDYSFCFSNEFSQFADKLVEFEIEVENEVKIKPPSKPGTTPEQMSVVEEAIIKISSQLSTINRNHKYFRTRENRNFSTARSTEDRIFRFSIIESFLIILMGLLQVFTVRFFFQGSRKGFV